MALIKCPECEKEVSDLAESCPNCGLNIKRYILQQKLNDQEIKVKEVCIFRKNCASVPEERSAIPLQTEQSSAG